MSDKTDCWQGNIMVEPVMFNVGGIPRFGFPIRWYYDVEETLVNAEDQPLQLYYYKHEPRPRNSHQRLMRMMDFENPSFTNHGFQTLHLGTQINIYRHAQ